ncbi:ABC transporter ATP-binding protein [Desulfopila inferna]|uniref:ABC transporter ATP-binding protein n=1 Tax=Desulfopila inferna TaxID=468528 RepID=UPI00196686D4|nr:ABC transporter ATP-binding protein [Desulfopila inferna]MBM9603773.1 ABC transporter ATP-binding protein [Desulfopila inferna]
MVETILEVKGLNKSYGALQATKELSFAVERGHIHALIGPNGAGKTTLVNQLTGDIRSDSGRIIYKNKDITGLRDYRRARLGIARSFQITHIFENLSVAENMALSICANDGHNFRFWSDSMKSRIVREKLPEALERIDLNGRADVRASALSHGEKRQLEVGMALTGKPEFLILDEPMAGLGPGGTIELSKLIKRLKGDLTILLVEHDMDVVFALADIITVLVYGENILTAPPSEIRRDERVRSAYLGEGE